MVRPKDKKEEKEKYAQWKQNLPIMYDWIMNHPLTWPSQSCRQALCSRASHAWKHPSLQDL